jgi:hypothetical protein
MELSPALVNAISIIVSVISVTIVSTVYVLRSITALDTRQVAMATELAALTKNVDKVDAALSRHLEQERSA